MSNSIPKILTLAAFLLAGVPAPAAADSCAPQSSLDGAWVGNDGGSYNIRVDGSTVWWVGMSGDRGNSWTNIFHGTRTGNSIIGEWVDVNGPMGKGSLMIQVADNMHMNRQEASGSGFGGTSWMRPGCTQTGQAQPQPQPSPEQQKRHPILDAVGLLLQSQPPPPQPDDQQ